MLCPKMSRSKGDETGTTLICWGGSPASGVWDNADIATVCATLPFGISRPQRAKRNGRAAVS